MRRILLEQGNFIPATVRKRVILVGDRWLVNRRDKIAALRKLSEESHGLASARPIFGQEFFRWHERTVETLQQIYGADSGELSEFLRISFELDPTALDSFERQLRPHAEKIRRSLFTGKIDLSSSQERQYTEALASAGELLLGLVVGLRTGESD